MPLKFICLLIPMQKTDSIGSFSFTHIIYKVRNQWAEICIHSFSLKTDSFERTKTKFYLIKQGWFCLKTKEFTQVSPLIPNKNTL